METEEQEIRSLIERVSPEETRDSEVLKVVKMLCGQTRGIYNKGMRLLEERLKNYTKIDFKKFTKEARQDDLELIEETKKSFQETVIEISEELMQKHDIITIKTIGMSNILRDNAMMMMKNGISYSSDMSPLTIAIRDGIDSKKCSSYVVAKRNVLARLADSTLFDPTLFDTNPFVIPFNNGIFNVETADFVPVEQIDARYHKFFYHLPFELKINESNTDCPKFREALNKWLKSPFTPEDVFEAWGYSLSTSTSFKKAFILLGPTNTAKTQFMNILLYLIPENARSSTPIHRITKDQFGTDDLIFKIDNICDDLPDNKVLHSGLFKNLIGGTLSFQAEIKGGKKVSFVPYAKHWYATNILGELSEPDDDAFFSRFIIYPFEKAFDLNDSNTIKDFYKTIINDPNEIQGILSQCLLGYIELIKRGHFREEIQQNTKHLWLYNADPVYRFLYHSCNRNSTQKIECKEFYTEAMSECPGKTKQGITLSLFKYGIPKNEAKIKGTQKNTDYFYGIEWKESYKKKVDNNNEETSGKINTERIFTSEKNKQITEYNINKDYADPNNF